MRTTIKKWLDKELESALLGETIEGIVFGEFGWGGYLEVDEPGPKKCQLYSLDEAMVYLEREFDCGYGSPETYAINIWTDKRVFFVTQYDGSTSLDWVYRHPTAYCPSMPGG